jgi:hypothetical protein
MGNFVRFFFVVGRFLGLQIHSMDVCKKRRNQTASTEPPFFVKRNPNFVKRTCLKMFQSFVRS